MSSPDLHRAAIPGRIRGIGLELYQRALASPHAAGGVLRRGLREARALHSRERRLVADLLYGLIRHQGRLDRTHGTADPLARWLGLLAHHGLDAAVAAEAWRAERDAPVPAFTPDLDAALAGLPPDEALAAAASVPPAIAASLRRVFGDEAPRFVAASNERAPVVLRVGHRQRDLALERLRAAGLAAEPTVPPDGLRLPPGTDVQHHPALHGLSWELQDEASQRVAALLNPAPGQLVLDLCAGAGGKSLAIADRHPRARVAAWDIRPAALRELERRAHDARVRVRVGLPSEPVDHLLVDAPCTGTGTWRRHPELRWRLDDLAPTVDLQRRILDDAAPRVRPGGTLLYATCSVLPEEDEDQISSFILRHPEYEAVEPPLRTAPHTDGTDGFFAAKLRRR
jgi:16S rRNA (cytosine967-C5)-methyltransferase